VICFKHIKYSLKEQENIIGGRTVKGVVRMHEIGMFFILAFSVHVLQGNVFF